MAVEKNNLSTTFARFSLMKTRILSIMLLAILFISADSRLFAWQEGSTGSTAQPSDTKLVPTTPQTKGLGHYGEWWRIPDDNARLTFREDEWLRWPLPPGEEKYASVKGEDVKKLELEVVAISERSKSDGNQLWGRIAGTKYDHMAADWVKAHFEKSGLQVHQEEQSMPPQWMPLSWQASVEMNGKSLPVDSVMPIPNSVGTLGGPIEADIVWLGEGYAADFQGRDVKGKVALMYSYPTPGGEDSVRIWGGGPERAAKAGAALVIEIQGFPGSATNFHGTPGTGVPSIVISYDDGLAIRQAIEAGRNPKFKLNLHVEEQTGLKTETTWGILPGMTDEKIIFLAHHDAYFDGAMDNASGMAMMQYIAAHYAAMPKEMRKRTMVFMDTPLHHTFVIKEPLVNVGARWLRDNVDRLFPHTVLVFNCEHITEAQFDFLGAGMMSTNTTVGHPFFVDGSEDFKDLVMSTLHEFGVAVYRVREPSPGGELGQTQFYRTFPSFHVIDREFYHTTLDSPEWTPAAGMESTTRAYLKILDTVNGWDRDKIWGTWKPRATSSRPF